MVRALTVLVHLACSTWFGQASPKTDACSGKAEAAACSFTYSGGSKVGTTASGTCVSGSCTEGQGGGSSGGNSGVSSGVKAGKLTDAEIALFVWNRVGKQTNKLSEDIGVDGQVSITKSADGKSLIIKSNGIPQHDAGYDGTPNSMAAMDYTYTLPADPELTASDSSTSAGCLPYSPIGFTLAGTAMFSPFTANFKTDTGKVVSDTCCDPVALEGDLVDECNGHGSPYHYHALSKCVLPDVTCGTPGRIIGVMFDGIGIFTPADTDGTPIDSSKLDRCGGMTGKDGRYRYHIQKKYPHLIGCFRGATRASEMSSKCACMAVGNVAHTTCPYTMAGDTTPACTLCSNTKCMGDKHSKTCDSTCQACKDTGACAKYCAAGATIKTIVPWKVADQGVRKSNAEAMHCSVGSSTTSGAAASTTATTGGSTTGTATGSAVASSASLRLSGLHHTCMAFALIASPAMLQL